MLVRMSWECVVSVTACHRNTNVASILPREERPPLKGLINRMKGPLSAIKEHEKPQGPRGVAAVPFPRATSLEVPTLMNSVIRNGTALTIYVIDTEIEFTDNDLFRQNC